MRDLKQILLAEDDPRNLELTLKSLAACGLANEVCASKPVGFHDFGEALKGLGLFWALLNKPPPGSAPKSG